METQILGPEYDQDLAAALKAVLQQMGAVSLGGSWGVAGSQEVASGDFEIGGERLHVESETYIGLSISGAAPLLAEVGRRVEEQRLTAGQGLALGR